MAVFIGWTILSLIIWIVLGEEAVVQNLSVVFIGGLVIGFGLDRLSKNKKVIELYYKVFRKKVWKIYKKDAIDDTRIWADVKRGDKNDEMDFKDIIHMLGIEDLVLEMQEEYKNAKVINRKRDEEFFNLMSSINNKDK